MGNVTKYEKAGNEYKARVHKIQPPGIHYAYINLHVQVTKIKPNNDFHVGTKFPNFIKSNRYKETD